MRIWRAKASGSPLPGGYVIRQGVLADAEAIYTLVFAAPDPNILQRTRSEVAAMLHAGEFYVALTHSGAMIAACYIRQPADGATEAEFGGAFVDPNHRRGGLFRLLGDVALADYRVQFDVEQPLIAHVVVGNEKPRGVLQALGFEVKDSDQRFTPNSYAGLLHMAVEKDGFIHADTFVFRQEAYRDRMRGVINSAGTLETQWGPAPVRIQLVSYTSGAMAEVLTDLGG